MNALCIRCHGAVGPDGRCPRCVDGTDLLERELARLRAEIARAPAEDVASPEEGAKTPANPVKAGSTGAAGESATDGSPVPAPGQAAPSASDGPPRSASAGSAAPAPDPPPASASDGSATPRLTSTPAEPTDSVRGPSPERTDSRRHDRARIAGGPGMRARELDVTTEQGAWDALDEVLRHRRRGRGKIIGIAGLPRHGKTRLADRLRQRAAARPGVDLRYDKTARGRVNLYYVPGRDQHHVLVDVAGEDFQVLGDYNREVPALMTRFLWPVLQELDGLLLLMALPLVWSGWNAPAAGVPDARARHEMERARVRMVDAHRTLLKYALVARGLRSLPRRLRRRLGLSAEVAPGRHQVDDAFAAAPALAAPVLMGFSKADLYGAGRRGLVTPPLPGAPDGVPVPVHPLRTDPMTLGRVHFPELFDFLLARVRHFKFDFVQALEDPSASPDPREARVADAPIRTLVGAESALSFLTDPPWRFPGISTRTALRLDRLLHPGRWNGGARAALEGHAREGTP